MQPAIHVNVHFEVSTQYCCEEHSVLYGKGKWCVQVYWYRRRNCNKYFFAMLASTFYWKLASVHVRLSHMLRFPMNARIAPEMLLIEHRAVLLWDLCFLSTTESVRFVCLFSVFLLDALNGFAIAKHLPSSSSFGIWMRTYPKKAENIPKMRLFTGLLQQHRKSTHFPLLTLNMHLFYIKQLGMKRKIASFFT